MTQRCIYPTPSPRARSYTRSIFKPSKADLNSEISFSLTGCLTKVTQSAHSYGGEKRWIYTFLKSISTNWNAYRLIQDLNSSNGFHFLLRKPLCKVRLYIYCAYMFHIHNVLATCMCIVLIIYLVFIYAQFGSFWMSILYVIDILMLIFVQNGDHTTNFPIERKINWKLYLFMGLL